MDTIYKNTLQNDILKFTNNLLSLNNETTSKNYAKIFYTHIRNNHSAVRYTVVNKTNLLLCHFI